MKVNFITLGCSKNTVDTEFVAGAIAKNGNAVYFERAANDCDCVVINTCGFIGDAKQESVDVILQQIEAKRHFDRRHHADGRKRTLIAAGCLVERYRDELKEEMPEVDRWYGVHEWDTIASDLLGTPQNLDSRLVSTPRHYAYLKISEGCNRNCAYCAIPLIRGRHVSRPIDDLVEEAKRLVNDGVKELIVIAQDTTYYGIDRYGERRIGELLRRLATESGATWIRLHYTYPSSFPQDAIDAIRQYDNICNYIDIPLQHVSSHILESMRRGIDRKGTIALIEKFRKEIPDVCIRTTLIVGYPGESEQDFEELKDFVRQARFNRMGCFTYSPEEGTPAEALGDPVPEEEKQRRIDELMEIQEAISLELNEARVGKTCKVIIDRCEGDFFIGRTEHDSPDVDDEVLVGADSAKKIQIGGFYTVRITQALENDLYAEFV